MKAPKSVAGVIRSLSVAASARFPILLWLLVLVLGCLDFALLRNGFHVRSQLKQTRRALERAVDHRVDFVGPCSGIDVSGQPLADLCASGAIVTVVDEDALGEELRAWAPLTDRASNEGFRVVGICADMRCVRRARALADLPFPIMSGSSFLVARAAGLAAQQGSFIVVTPQGVIADRLPIPRTAAEAAALSPRIDQVAHADSP
jgi:hypothetical protein